MINRKQRKADRLHTSVRWSFPSPNTLPVHPNFPLPLNTSGFRLPAVALAFTAARQQLSSLAARATGGRPTAEREIELNGGSREGRRVAKVWDQRVGVANITLTTGGPTCLLLLELMLMLMTELNRWFNGSASLTWTRTAVRIINACL